MGVGLYGEELGAQGLDLWEGEAGVEEAVETAGGGDGVGSSIADGCCRVCRGLYVCSGRQIVLGGQAGFFGEILSRECYVADGAVDVDSGEGGRIADWGFAFCGRGGGMVRERGGGTRRGSGGGKPK